MTTIAAMRAWHEAQVGTVEGGGPDGHSGNIVHYWEDIGHHEDEGLSWCGAYEDAACKATGLKVPGSMISTQAGATAFKDAGLWVPVSKGGQPGDFSFFGWNGGKKISDIDHVGWVSAVLSRASVQDFEGNTSAQGNSGQSQRNGGMVAKRTRSTDFIVGYGRPVYDTTPAAPTTVLSSNPWNFHDHPIQATQWALGGKVTGNDSKALRASVGAFQKRQGLVANGALNQRTVLALMQIKHTRTL
jgi:hypothetical protein